ncbi:MAG: GNAT family N-acetyltransferase [Ignavibacteriaceae bacterium]|jgi:GNAT superfamily N-acetyltransferase
MIKKSGTEIIKNVKLSFYPLTIDRWKDFEQLFGERGACGGCWCMLWRLRRAQFEKQKGSANKNAMKKLVSSGETPGILAYYDARAVAWCSVASREKFVRLENSKVLKRIDDKPVWSVSCIFIVKEFRRKGVSTELLKAAITFFKSRGAKIVEAYPQEPYSSNIPAAFAWTGVPSSFEKAGFELAGRRSKMRPIMRYYI